ncbi:MAG: CoA transferase [Acidobacteria bacterium]|nr:CoA transferase [Acidobacteriota bacterium]
MKPLSGVVVLDASRMLPGAVLASRLLALGARVLKVEDPAGGDPMRSTPPFLNGTGAGFATFLAGAESVALDLREAGDARAFAKIARHVDVVVESFRPGTLDRWGLGLANLRRLNPRLVTVSLPSYGGGEDAKRVGHDLNFLAESGLLALLGGDVPKTQLVDVSAGLLAAEGVLGALLQRSRTGTGGHVEQPLRDALEPFLAWPRAEALAGPAGASSVLLGGACPAYGLYAAGDGQRIALGALEPKFWQEWLALLGLPGYADAGLDPGERGAEARRAVEARLLEKPAASWVALARERGLPVSAVSAGVAPAAPLPSATPALGAHTGAVLRAFGAGDRV